VRSQNCYSRKARAVVGWRRWGCGTEPTSSPHGSCSLSNDPARGSSSTADNQFLVPVLPQQAAESSGESPPTWSRRQRSLTSTYSRGTLVRDMSLAALAIEHSCELATTNRDYARFAGLRWRHPLG